ncbi:thermonuclease family protein [Patescibacteria group bacterium]|nr:thermonuclease family protein [Patescibacteria group bacterium]
MYQYKAKIVRWIDGDTVLVDIDLGFFCTRQERLRLARISAHELNSETLYGRRRARSARHHAELLCPVGSEVIVETSKSDRDRYARYIAEIIFEGENISDELLARKLVKKFKPA